MGQVFIKGKLKMRNFLVLAEAAAPDAPAVAEAPVTPEVLEAPVTPETPETPETITVPGQPLDEAAATTGTQAPGSPAPQQQERPAAPAGSGIMQILFIVAIFVLMYFMFIRGPKKQQQQQQEMIRALQKNDRVRTVGGIIGTVVDVKDEYVTLKVDETTNTKIRIVPGAISKNLAPETKD